jgi:ribosomal protein S18 acetylase RimI-like enzyme
MDEAAWRHHFANPQDPEFRPEHSLLLRAGNDPIAYAVCHTETADPKPPEAWITQMGVRPAWRRRGVATALLVEALRRFQMAGHAYALLSVNVDNPAARQVYQRVGFRLTKRLTMYRKVVA